MTGFPAQMAGEHSRRAQEGGPEGPTHKVLSQSLDVFLRITHPGPSREASGAVDHRPVLATGYSGSWGQAGSREKVMVFTWDPCPGVMGCEVLTLVHWHQATWNWTWWAGGQAHGPGQQNLHREGPPPGEMPPQETVS